MIVVTGGAGFIGSSIVWRLNTLGKDNIILVDELGTTDKWKNLVGLKFQEFIHKDDLISIFPFRQLFTWVQTHQQQRRMLTI